MTVKDITFNPGLLPIQLGSARLQKTEHTLVHFYDLLPIKKEIDVLNDHYKNLSANIHRQHGHYTEIENYDLLFRHLIRSVREKISNIYPQTQNRSKRGLIDGLGSVIKFFTGNMDAKDADRINKITEHLKNNQMSLQAQIDNQYSLNTDIMKQFNATVKNIEYNENLLKRKIINVNENLINTTRDLNAIHLKDLFNQLILTYNTVLNILTDIENSLTFCSIGVMHPSVIKINDLFQELQKLVPFYKEGMPMPVTMSNIFKYQSLIQLHCKHDEDKIIYFLTVPIEYDVPFELYYLESLPTRVDNKYFTIIPNFKYILKNKDTIRPLLSICNADSNFHCPTKLVTAGNTTCEANILRKQSTQGCIYTEIYSKEDQLQPLQHANQYLGWFQNDSTLEVQCSAEKQILRPKNIFLIKISRGCKLIFKNDEYAELNPTKSIPIMIDFKIPQHDGSLPKTKIKLELKSLKLKEIHQYPFQHVTTNVDQLWGYYTPNLWTMGLYAFLVIFTISIIWKKYQSWKNASPPRTNADLQDTMNPRRLPAEASF